MLYLRAATLRLRKRLTPLALRLTIVACALTLPVLWFASLQQAKLYASVGERTAEIASIHWIVLGATLGSEQDVFSNGPARSRARSNLRLRLAELRRYASASASTIVTGPASAAEIDRAWIRLLAAPGAASLGNVTDTTFRALAAVSNSSHLSFENDPVAADLGDTLGNALFSVCAPLEAAVDVVRLHDTRRPLSLDDRILLAGLVAGARSNEPTLRSDVTNAELHDPSLRTSIGSPYARVLAAVRRLAEGIERTARSQRRADPSSLVRLRAALVAPSLVLIDALARQTVARLDALERDTENDRRRLLAQSALAVILDFAGVVFAGRLIVSRYRNELVRAKEQARVLTAELARQQAEHARMLTEAQFDAVFDRSQLGIALLDRSGVTTECNPALSGFLGNATPRIVSRGDARFENLLAGFERTYQYEGPLVRADGSAAWAEITVSSIDVPDSATVAAIAIVQDITERKATGERLRFAAAHDELTLLPNRKEFLSRLDVVLARGVNLGRYAVLFVDIDKFKLVNDTLGHSAGDRVIAIAAQRLVATTRAGDIVARLHGDEFAVLARDAGGRVPGEIVATRIKETFLTPITIDGTAIVLTASVGIVPGLTGYAAAESVLRDADVAMYNAKKLGRSTAVTFDDGMHARLGKHMRMLTEIRLAIDRSEFRLVYQPIVDLRSGTIKGVEALMRWHHPTLGVVSPVEFIPVAEETDAIEYLGRLALRETCAMLRRMDAAGMRAITASVNLSVPHLSNGEVVSDVRTVLADSQISAPRLMLEITESALLENGTRAANVLSDLAALGVRLCIDDFGTGYSSLRYLQQYPISALKIDRSFVYAASGEIASEPIVHMLLTLARSLDMSVIAEGIESETQRASLLAGGCDFGQGYLFSKPLDEPALMRYIRDDAAGNFSEATVA